MPTLAEASSPDLKPSLFLDHYRTIREATRLKDEAAMALTRAKKAAKTDGVDIDAMKILERLAKLDDDEAELRMRHAFEYAGWLGRPLGTQASLFPEAALAPTAHDHDEQEQWEAGEAGYAAGKGGKLRSDNPFPSNSPLFVAWDREFMRGLTLLADGLELKDHDEADRKQDARARPMADARAKVLKSPPPTRRGKARANTLTH